MLSRTYAILDEAQKGPLLELEQGALIVTCNTVSTDGVRMVRGSIGRRTVDGGVHGFECVFYGTDDLTTAAVGLASATDSLTAMAGDGTGGTNVGLRPGLGEIVQDGSTTTTTEVYGQRVIFTVVADFSNPAAPTAYFFADGSLIDGVLLSPGTYYPAVSVGSPDAAYELRAFCNFGQRKFKRSVVTSAKLIDGWYAGRVAPRRVHLIAKHAGGAVIADASGVPRSYYPTIRNSRGFRFDRRCTAWMWGRRSTGTSFGQLELDNRDGAYDDLLTNDYRDALLRISVVQLNRASVVYPNAAKVVLATGVVDRIDGIAEDGVRITIKDRLAKLQKPLQTDSILPYFDEGAANEPMPITIGACRNVEPLLVEATERLYIAHDAPLTNIARVRDKGAPLTPHSNPPQYTPAPDLNGVTLETDPVGKVTMDISSIGQQVVIPGTADVLGGLGEFSTWPVSGDPPTGWIGGGSGTRSRIGAGAPFKARLLTSTFYAGTGGFFGIWLRTSSNVFEPGKNYRITFTISASSGGVSAYGDAGVPYGLMLRTALNALPPSAITPHMRPISVPNVERPDGGVENYTFGFQCPPGSALPLYIIVTAPQGTITGVGNGPGSVTVHDVRIERLGEATQNLPLQGVTFLEYYREVFRRAGLDDSEWSQADAANLDTPITLADGTQVVRTMGLHVKAGEGMSAFAAAMAPMDGITGAIFTDADGVIRMRELIDPRWWRRPGAPPVALMPSARFTQKQIQPGVEVTADVAPGLSTSVGACKNWSPFGDSDLVSDTDTVPPATRAAFKRDFQLQSTTAFSMSASYTHAISAAPLPTLFDDIAIGEVMRDRTLYSYSTLVDPPRFVRYTVFFDDVQTIPVAYFGDYIDIMYPRFGLNRPENLRAVVDASYWPDDGRVEFYVWGGT